MKIDSEKLKALMNANSFYREDIAEKAGVSTSVVSKARGGEATSRTVRRLAIAFKLNYKELLMEDEK